MKRHLAILALMPAIVLAASSNGLSFEQSSNFPSGLWKKVHGSRLLETYVMSAHLNPFYLHGDFDGDGRLDTAVLIRHRNSKKAGIAIFQSSSELPVILGAGRPLPGSRGDNFDWMDSWQVRPRSVISGAKEFGPPPTLKGDAILVIKLEAASALLYWNGTAYGWYQQDD